jgi:hypothetical protein
MKNLILSFIFLVNLISTKSQKVITGCYGSNFAIIGWFGAKITFNEDQSFDYLFAGDLYYDKINGTYNVKGKDILLHFDEHIDTLEIPFTDSLGYNEVLKLIMPKNNASGFRPSKLRMKKEKLILFEADGKRIRWKMNANERWKRYFWVGYPCEDQINDF